VTYYGQWNGQGRYLLEQTLATGEERPILPRLPRLQPPQVEVSDPVEPPLGGGRLRRSPDGQVLLGGQTYADRTILLTYDLRTEETRVVFEIDRPAAINTEDGVQWTADGRALVANVRGEAENQFELWWIPVDGRAPHRLDIGVDDLVNSAVAVHPDGKQVAFVAGRPTFGRTSTADYEFRKLEQFVAPIQADETAR